jgi:MerR family transcriptional regulator, copper efflux regulator
MGFHDGLLVLQIWRKRIPDVFSLAPCKRTTPCLPFLPIWRKPLQGRSKTVDLNEPKGLTIGQVARRAGFGIETVRFYERNELIEKPPRRASGYRQYPESVISRQRFIRRAKEFGFASREIEELRSLRVDPSTTCSDIRERAEAKFTDIDGKIQSLERMKEVLTSLTTSCSGAGPVSECPIVEASEREERG